MSAARSVFVLGFSFHLVLGWFRISLVLSELVRGVGWVSFVGWFVVQQYGSGLVRCWCDFVRCGAMWCALVWSVLVVHRFGFGVRSLEF